MPVKRFACAEDIPAILEIWKSGFPEDEETTPLCFLEKIRLEEECLLAVEDGRPVSMAFLLPCRLGGPSGGDPVQYIYAAATLKAYRGRGIFGELLRESLEIGKARGQAGSFLRPADTSLVEYYGAFGYRPFFYTDMQRASVSAWQADKGSVFPAEMTTAADYAVLREQCLAGYPLHISWEKRFITYALRLAELEGGQGAAFPFPEGPGCALYDLSEEVLTVRELLCPPGREESCLLAIVQRSPCRTLQWRKPARRRDSAYLFGLWRPFSSRKAWAEGPADDHPPYMGLALD